MRTLARLAAVSLAALAAAAPSHAATPTPAPTGLKGFLLRADEPVRREFSRTPSFAWDPVPGAVRYQFQLATSKTFRENGVVFSETVTAPAVSLPITLPWITGSPYSLYARVRAVRRGETTPWSDAFGFNMRWSTLPKPLASYPGLIRWTPVEGADAYQVWFVDIGKIVTVRTNVVDEREFYTFHQGSQWIGEVRYRLRSLRGDANPARRVNGVPAVSHGPWSPVYKSVNPPFSVGPLTPLATVSDVVAKGRTSDAPHRLMPAFVFTGNAGLLGVPAELYRVYVSTDSECVNVVYTSALIGSPAYAPRPYGPLALPTDGNAIAAARGSYLVDGGEGATYTADFVEVKTSESLPAAKPTTTVSSSSGDDSDDSPGEASDTAGETEGAKEGAKEGAGSGSSSGSEAAAGSGSNPDAITVNGNLGAPVDLWDVDWPQGGYYWTVVPVLPIAPAAFSTTLAAVAASGATQIQLASAAGLAVGDTIVVGSLPGDTVVVVEISGATVTISKGLSAAYGPGQPVVRSAGSFQYRDLELAQEACAAGRVMRFGKESEPALTSGSAPFASGLSPDGRLTAAATKTPSFYGSPHVAWTPALGASAYEVQWSKRRYPFVPAKDPRTGQPGLVTLSTSASLPLAPGTWWYRVRGINWSLPTGAQRMGWSDPAQLLVAKPTYKVVKRTGR